MKHTGNPTNSVYKGIFLIILSAFCFALMSTFVRLAGDLPSLQKSFFRNIVALVFAASVLLRTHKRPKIKHTAWKFLILRSVFGTIGLICNFYAIDRLVLADASILNKMSPFFAILCSYFVLKEKLSLQKALIVFGAFIGSLFVIKPSFTNADLLPALTGLLGGLGAGVAYTFVRRCGEEGVKGPFIVFFFSAFSCVVTLPMLIFNYTPMQPIQLVYLLLAGLAATGGQFTITAAYICAPARDISVYDYTQIIFSSALGFFIFGQTPDWLSAIGYIIIIAMAVVMFLTNKQHAKTNENKNGGKPK